MGTGVGEERNMETGVTDGWKMETGVGEDDSNNEGVTRPLSHFLETPNLFLFCLILSRPMLLRPATVAEDLGRSAKSSCRVLTLTPPSSIVLRPDTVVISVSFRVVIFSVFFMKSVNIWNLSSSDILLGVVTGAGSGLVAVPSLGVVKGGRESDLAVVRGAGSRVLSSDGRGVNFLRGSVGRLGRNLDSNNFLLSFSTFTSLRSVSAVSSSSSPGLSPNIEF